MTPVGDLLVVTPVAFAGNCLGLRLGEAPTLRQREDRLKAKETASRVLDNMMDGEQLASEYDRREKQESTGLDTFLTFSAYHPKVN